MLAVHAGSAFFARQVDARAVQVYRETDLPIIAGQQGSRTAGCRTCRVQPSGLLGISRFGVHKHVAGRDVTGLPALE